MRVTNASRRAVNCLGVIALAGVLSTPVSAQTNASAGEQVPAPVAPQGPLVLEPIKDRWVIAPEAKVTEIDGTTAGLIGGYGGILLQGSVLVGGAAYTMLNGPRDSELTYGGVMVGVTFGDERRLSYGVRGLVGVGTSQLSTSIRFGAPLHSMPDSRNSHGFSTETMTQKVRFDETFLVAEPQAEVAVRLAESWRLAFGVGYRFTNASDYTSDRVNGATGTVAIVFGGR